MCSSKAGKDRYPRQGVSVSQEHPINTAIRRTTRVALATLGCAALVSGGLVACGTAKQLTAADKVSEAFRKLGDAKTFKAELSVEATADQLVAFGTAAHDPIKRDEAAMLADLALSVSVSADKPLKDIDGFKSAQKSGDLNTLNGSKDLDFSYVLSSKRSATAYFDMRQVDAKTYLKVDARALAELTGQDASAVDDMIDTAPPGTEIIKELLQGHWVSADPAVVEQFTKDAGKAGAANKPLGQHGGAGTGAGAPSATPSTAPSVDPKTVDGVLGSLKDVLAKNISFDDRGTLGGLNQIHVSAPARDLADGFLKAVTPLAKQLDPKFGTMPDAAHSDVPDRRIGADVFLRDGSLSAVTFDFAQFTDESEGSDTGAPVHFPVKLTFGHDVPAIEAPTGAREVTQKDLDALMEALAADQRRSDAEDIGGTGFGGPGTGIGGTGFGADAPPLTEDQLKQLEDAGMEREVAIQMNEDGGFRFEELLKLAHQKV